MFLELYFSTPLMNKIFLLSVMKQHFYGELGYYEQIGNTWMVSIQSIWTSSRSWMEIKPKGYPPLVEILFCLQYFDKMAITFF